MNILDFFCEEKQFSEQFKELRSEYFKDLADLTNTCSECDLIYVQKKYLHTLFNIMKNFNDKDK